MSNSINTNIAALSAQANIAAASNAAASSVARLSSGNRIVQASDDVTALAIGTSLGSQVNALKTAQTNASQGTSLLQVADGALAQIQSILQQQQSIANQAQSGTLTNTDRSFLDTQFQKLSATINSIASGTTFNGVNLVDGSIAAAGTVGSSNPLLTASADATSIGGFASAIAGSSAQSADAATGQGLFNYGTFTVADTDKKFGAASISGPSAGGNDVTLTQTALQAIVSGDITVTANGTVDATGAASVGTGYTVSLVAGGVTYTGTLAFTATGDPANAANTTHGADGSVLAGSVVTLTNAADPNHHASIQLTVGSAGFTGASHAAGDVSADVKAGISTVFAAATATTGAVGPVTVTAGTGYDTALQGDLSTGSINVYASLANGTAATVGASGTAKGYTIQYSINGQTYSAFLANSDNGAGHGITSAPASISLQTATNSGVNSTIAIAVVAAFGTGGSQNTDQSDNIKAALTSAFEPLSLVSPTSSATISGTTATGGINSVAATNNIGKNDTALVGDLSQGTFNVTGSNANGFNVAYTTASGSTYQGTFSAAKATDGGKLILTNGDGSLSFTIGATATATGSTADVFKADLATFFTSTTNSVTTGATALATHAAATVLAKDSSGVAIANSGITSASTAGTVLAGFTGANVKLTSASYTAGDDNLPPIANFTATGSGLTTVFSVTVNGVTYSTGNTSNGGRAVTNPSSTLQTATFDNGTGSNSAGILTFFKNGDDTSKDQLVLDVHSVTGAATINTTADVTNVVAALNGAFGAGGSTGGLNFQLGATSGSNVVVNIGGATTTALFGATPLSVATATSAAAAATAVSSALDTITAIRADVGAYEQQFGFAAANIQSSVQNSSAAQSSLLDTDIAAESTSFATSQVKLQAGISVLAQANQQLQALLKLIS